MNTHVCRLEHLSLSCFSVHYYYDRDIHFFRARFLLQQKLADMDMDEVDSLARFRSFSLPLFLRVDDYSIPGIERYRCLKVLVELRKALILIYGCDSMET